MKHENPLKNLLKKETFYTNIIFSKFLKKQEVKNKVVQKTIKNTFIQKHVPCVVNLKEKIKK